MMLVRRTTRDSRNGRFTVGSSSCRAYLGATWAQLLVKRTCCNLDGTGVLLAVFKGQEEAELELDYHLHLAQDYR